MTSYFLKDKFGAPFHGIQLPPGYLSHPGYLSLWSNIQSYASASSTTTEYSQLKTISLLLNSACVVSPSLPNTILLVVMVKYPLFSEADPSCKARQYLTSLSFSNFCHISLLTGCDRLWELHLWIAKSRYTIHMWKVFNISLFIFFKEKCL